MARSSPWRSLTCSSRAGSKSVPITAATVSSRRQASDSRTSRRLTTSRTRSGHVAAGQREHARPAVGLVQVAHDLLGEERVAVGLRLDGAGQLGSEVTPRDVVGEPGDVLVREPPERHPLHELSLREALERLGLRLGRPLAGTLRGQHQQPCVGTGLQHVAQQRRRGLVGPVQVVDQEQDRGLARQLLEQARHRLEEPVALALARRLRLVVRGRRRPGGWARPAPGRRPAARPGGPAAPAPRRTAGGPAPRPRAGGASAGPRSPCRGARWRPARAPRAPARGPACVLPMPASPATSASRAPAPWPTCDHSRLSASSSASRPTKPAPALCAQAAAAAGTGGPAPSRPGPAAPDAAGARPRARAPRRPPPSPPGSRRPAPGCPRRPRCPARPAAGRGSASRPPAPRCGRRPGRAARSGRAGRPRPAGPARPACA